MKKILISSMIVASLLANSFSYATEKPVTSRVFGVCDCSEIISAPNSILLTLNDDATFNYKDDSNPNEKRSINGTWVSKKNKIQLTAKDNQKSFHRKWKLVNKGQCARSRYQLNFQRICLVKPC